MFAVVLLLCLMSVTSRQLAYYRELQNEIPMVQMEYNRHVQQTNKETLDYKYAECNIQPNPSKPDLLDKVYGMVQFKQRVTGGKTLIYVSLSGFSTTDNDTEHGFHIHAYGTIQEGCEGAGGHYNPYGSLHGSPLDDKDGRHVGDLGNVLESGDGTVLTRFTDDLVSLVSPQSVMGRAVVVHQKQDDLGKGGDAESLKTGNAGTRVACCVISATTGDFWGAN